MRKPWRSLIPASASAFLLSGCIATQRDVLDLEGQMDSLQVEMVKLRQTMEGVQKNQADLTLRMEGVQTDLGRFAESLSGFRDQVETLNTRMEDLSAALEVSNKRLQDAADAKAAAAARTPSDILREAEAQLMRKEYDLALQGLELYLKDNPKGTLADQAHYSMGEAYYATGRFAQAARSYAQILDGFPSSKLTAAARLRYALSLTKLDASKKSEAERYLESIVEDFPGTPEAKKAEEYLAEFRPKAAPKPSKAPAAPKTGKNGGAKNASGPGSTKSPARSATP